MVPIRISLSGLFIYKGKE